MTASTADRWQTCSSSMPSRVARSGNGRTYLPRRLCVMAAFLLAPNLCGAQTMQASTDSPLDGYLGVGALSFPSYAGSSHTQSWLIPIARIEYRETAYIYLDRVGVRLWSNDAKKIAFGVAGETRLGFHAKDDPSLTGMSTRQDAVEGGPIVEWQLPQLSLSLGYFADLSSVSGGRSVRLSVDRQLLDTATWDMDAYLDFDRSNSSIVQYYFGVRPNEATIARPYYQPGATVNSTLGLSGAYKLDKRHAILFGSEIGHLGESAAGSPVVQRRTGLMGYIGIGLVF